MSKAFVKDDLPEVDAAEALPERPARPLPITRGGYDRLAAELATLDPSSRRARVVAQVLATVELTEVGRLHDGVGFGCEVTVRDTDGQEKTYRIVGPDEVFTEGDVSVLAPLARALLGKGEGDEIILHRPRGKEPLEIIRIVP
jgi:transcription elongation GreA/GreB family factor